MKTVLLPAALFAAVAACASTRADEPVPKGDLAKLQGRWKATVGPQKNIPVTLTIKGTTASYAVNAPNGEEYKATGELKVNESAQPHKTIDWVKFTRPNGEPAPENLSIYEFVGDDLKLC